MLLLMSQWGSSARAHAPLSLSSAAEQRGRRCAPKAAAEAADPPEPRASHGPAQDAPCEFQIAEGACGAGGVETREDCSSRRPTRTAPSEAARGSAASASTAEA